MGGQLTTLIPKLLGKEIYKILLVGIGQSGKTTILNKLKFGELVKTTLTFKENVEIIDYENISFEIWDTPGESQYARQHWADHLETTDGIIYVIDSCDRNTFDETKCELYNLLKNDKFGNNILLVFANKQDALNAMTTSEITDKLGLERIQHFPWHIEGTSSVTGEGLYEGLNWLLSEFFNTSN